MLLPAVVGRRGVPPEGRVLPWHSGCAGFGICRAPSVRAEAPGSPSSPAGSAGPPRLLLPKPGARSAASSCPGEGWQEETEVARSPLRLSPHLSDGPSPSVPMAERWCKYLVAFLLFGGVSRRLVNQEHHTWVDSSGLCAASGWWEAGGDRPAPHRVPTLRSPAWGCSWGPRCCAPTPASTGYPVLTSSNSGWASGRRSSLRHPAREPSQL